MEIFPKRWPETQFFCTIGIRFHAWNELTRLWESGKAAKIWTVKLTGSSDMAGHAPAAAPLLLKNLLGWVFEKGSHFPSWGKYSEGTLRYCSEKKFLRLYHRKTRRVAPSKCSSALKRGKAPLAQKKIAAAVKSLIRSRRRRAANLKKEGAYSLLAEQKKRRSEAPHLRIFPPFFFLNNSDDDLARPFARRFVPR